MNKNLKEEMPQILNDFVSYLFSLSYSLATITLYVSNLLQFFRFLKKYFELDIEIKDFTEFLLLQVKECDIYAYMVYLNYERNNSADTRMNKLATIKVFYKWLCRKFPNRQNPAQFIEHTEKVFRLPKYLTLEQAKRIQIIFTKKNSRYPKRNNAIITLFLNSGMRLSELQNLNISDIDFENKEICIIGKGNKQRTVYFSEKCKDKLKEYLDTRHNPNLNEPLFTSNKKKRISKREVEAICRNAFKLLGIKRNFSTHTLRHTAATIIYQYYKEDILLLKKFLGHESISSTEIYTHVSNKNLKRAVDSNPLNKIA